MSHMLLVGTVYVIAVAVFLFITLKLFGSEFTFVDALLAAVLSFALSAIPTVGQSIGVIGVLVVVYWRANDVPVGAVLLASFVASLGAGSFVYKFLLSPG